MLGTGPTIDGVELADRPWRLAQRGAVAPGVRIIAGSVAEDSTFSMPNPKTTREQFEQWLSRSVTGGNTSRTAQLLALYPVRNESLPSYRRPGPEVVQPF